MANTASPNMSPTIAARGRPPQTGNTPSPPPIQQQPSKRERRRNQLNDRLNEMVTMFSAQHQHHYYAQLSAIQCDINLLMRADPYSSGPLDDSPEGIASQVAEVREEICKTRGRDIEPEAEESFKALGGKTFASFVDEINAAMEQRDTELTMLMNEYDDGLAELRKANQYKMQLAQEEHALLSKTLRDRLIQNVQQKKSKLMRDKEQLDIADSSALLLNPNQFSLGNPASPGGAQGNRKTRHTRLRPGDAEDVENTTAVEGNKRKRKAAFEDNDSKSPAPPGRNGDNGIASSYRDAKAKIAHTQFEAPLYSVERLFTEKDLALNMNKAHKATFSYFNRLKAQKQGQKASDTGARPGGGGDTPMTGVDYALGDTAAAADATALNVEGSGEVDSDANIFNPSPSLLYYLPRSSSQTFHATRSQRSTGLDVLSAAATGSTPFAVSINATASKSNPQAPPPAVLEDTYVQEDLDLMGLAPDNADMKIMQKRCLEKSSLLSIGQGETGAVDGESQARSLPVSFMGGHESAHGQLRPAPAVSGSATPQARGLVGGEAMSKTLSAGGINLAGQPAASTAMKRSVSTRT